MLITNNSYQFNLSKMSKIIRISLYLVLCSNSVFAQKDSVKVKFDFEIGLQRFYPNQNKLVHLPAQVKENRVKFSEGNSSFNKYSDIPQFHASIYSGLLSEIHLTKRFSLFTNLYLESRGQSFGALDVDNFVVFPIIYFVVNDTLKFLNKKIDVHIKVGDLRNYEENNGLTLNNIDVQGGQVKFAYKNWQFTYTLIGDISRHIGLNVSEFYSYTLKYKLGNDNNSSNIGLAINQFYFANDSLKTKETSINLLFNKNFKAFRWASEIGFKPDENTYGLMTRLTAHHVFLKDLSLNSITTVRYYSFGFNTNFSDFGLRYRKNDRFLRPNYIGEYLYPLYNSLNNFDQYSVYTEYLSDALFSLSTQIKLDKEIKKRFSVFLNYEGNCIRADESDFFFYNFFQGGLKYTLASKLTCSMFISNNIMNLDSHYQTFYQSRMPIIGFSVIRDLR